MKIKLEKKDLQAVDWPLILMLFALLAASLIILSTASVNVIEADPYHYVKTQALWIATGLVWVIIAAGIDYAHWRKISWGIYAFSLFLLLLVILVGSSAKGAQRWIEIASFRIQPSEFAKVMYIVTFAHFLSKRKGQLNNLRDFIVPFLYTLAPMALIMMQPDLGTALVFAAVFVGMMFVAGANPWKFGGLILGGIILVILALFFHFATDLIWPFSYLEGLPLPLKEYQLERITTFLDPMENLSGDGYNVVQSIWAIGSGGLWGKGYQNGTQGQLNFLPEHHTDFVFSVVGEEFGFIGTSTLLFLFCIFLLRSLRIAKNSRDDYGMLIVAGVVSMFAFHILVNIGMTSGIMPVTGLPLPFISFGGSAMWTNMMALGLIFSVAARREDKLMF